MIAARRESRPLPRPSSKDGTVRIEESTIKEVTQRFDLEIVFKLVLNGKGLPTIAGLDRCCNLVELNLANNLLTRIEGLDSLLQLRRLNLASNQICKIENLWHLEHLESLHLQDNKIASVDALSLPQLVGLTNLRTLALEQLDQTGGNPVCRAAQYRTAVLTALPNLLNLDGERSPATTSYGLIVAEMVQLVEHPPEPKPMEVPPVAPWLEGVVLDISAGDGPSVDAQAYASRTSHTSSALDSCQQLYKALVDDIARAKKQQQEGAKDKA